MASDYDGIDPETEIVGEGKKGRLDVKYWNQSFLTLNAIDGSFIDPWLGY